MFTKATPLHSAVIPTSGIWDYCFGHVSEAVVTFELSFFFFSNIFVYIIFT
jgi:hypothetical protein